MTKWNAFIAGEYSSIPVNIYLLKDNMRNLGFTCEARSKLKLSTITGNLLEIFKKRFFFDEAFFLTFITKMSIIQKSLYIKFCLTEVLKKEGDF